MRPGVALTAVLVALLAASPAGAITTERLRAAQRYAKAREGRVAFCVGEAGGTFRGLRRTEGFASASVVKAMLLVAALRRAGGRAVSPAERRRLTPMIRESSNRSARAIYALVGRPALYEVARAARMRRFAVTSLFSARIDAADQARFFLHLDAVVPPRHRSYARALLGGVVAAQRWGIPQVAARHGFRAYFKGGWRKGLTHQVALLERGGGRLSLAVLTADSPSQAYARRTVAGIAARLLG